MFTAGGNFPICFTRGSPFTIVPAREYVNKIFFGARIIAALNEESDTNLIDDPFLCYDFGGTIFCVFGEPQTF